MGKELNTHFPDRDSERFANPISRFNMMDGQSPERYEDLITGVERDDAVAAYERIAGQVPAPELVQLGGGRVLRVRKQGWENPHSKTVTVRALGFEGTLSKAAIGYQDYCLHEEIDGPMVTVETPGTGKSSSVDDSSLEAVETGDFSPLSIPILEYLKASGVKRINLLGYSFGSDVATAAAINAPDYSIEVVTMFVMASPSELERSVGELASAELGEHGKYSEDHMHPFVPERAVAYGYHRPAIAREMAAAKNIVSYAGRHPLHVYSYIKGMASGDGTRQRSRALGRNPNMSLVIGSTTNDEVAPHVHVKDNYHELRDTYERVRFMVFPGEDHGFEDQAETYATVAALALR